MGWASGQSQIESLQGGLARQHWRPSSPDVFFQNFVSYIVLPWPVSGC